MSIFQSFIFGIVQALTEFLPISSSAHLTLLSYFFDMQKVWSPQELTAFFAFIQLGTLISVFLFFHKDIKEIITHTYKDILIDRKPYKQQSHETHLGLWICIATLPIIIAGLLLKDLIEGDMTKNLGLIAINLIFFAFLLLISERIGKKTKDLKSITLFDGMLIGIGQMFSLFPGASRSGSTMTFALFAGLDRVSAAKFSFLLSLPAVFLSATFEFIQIFPTLKSETWMVYLVGTVTAAIAGYVVIKGLLKFLSSYSTNIFIIYRIILGIGILWWYI